MQPLYPNQLLVPKSTLLVFAIAISMTILSCNKIFPGGGVGNPTAITCNIQDFNLSLIGVDSITGGQRPFSINYQLFVHQLAPWANYILTTSQNIRYNNLGQPIVATPGNLPDSLYSFQYDNLNRLSVVTITENSFVSDSLDIETFRYRPGSILPDSLYLEDITKGPNTVLPLPYTFVETFTYDNNQRLSKIIYSAYAQIVGNPLYQRFHYNTQGDLDTVYESRSTFTGSPERPLLIVSSYDKEENCMLTNPTWTILSSLFSLNNPTSYTTNYNNVDGSLFTSYKYSMSYLYGGAQDNLPVSFFDLTTPTGQRGTVEYACTIGGGVTPVTGGQ